MSRKFRLQWWLFVWPSDEPSYEQVSRELKITRENQVQLNQALVALNEELARRGQIIQELERERENLEAKLRAILERISVSGPAPL